MLRRCGIAVLALVLTAGSVLADILTVDQIVALRRLGYNEDAILKMFREQNHRVAKVTAEEKLRLMNAGFSEPFIAFLAARVGEAVKADLEHIISMTRENRPVMEMLQYVAKIQPYKLKPIDAIKLTDARVPLVVRIALTGEPLTAEIVKNLAETKATLEEYHRLADIVGFAKDAIKAEDAAAMLAVGVPEEFIKRMKSPREPDLPVRPIDPRMFGRWQGTLRGLDEMGRYRPEGEIVIDFRRDRTFGSVIQMGAIVRDKGTYGLVDDHLLLKSVHKVNVLSLCRSGGSSERDKKVEHPGLYRSRIKIERRFLTIYDFLEHYDKVELRRIGEAQDE